MSYRSHADLGGTPQSRAVEPEDERVRFHAPWEPQALALTLAMGACGEWNIDMSRRTRETLPAYAQLSYYAIWFEALGRLLVERGLISEREWATGRTETPGRSVRRLAADQVAATLARGSPTHRPADRPARFAVGDRVRTRAAPADHHTRLPGYARGKVGRVAVLHGVHVLADTHAHGQGESPTWLYQVQFDARELWGNEALDASSRVSIDAWEPYLEPAA